MKRFTVFLLIAVMIMGCFGCSNIKDSDEPVIIRGDAVELLTDLGIPETFLCDIETADIAVMHDELKDAELGEIKFTELIDGDMHLSMLIVPIKDGSVLSRTVTDCIKIYGTYTWTNSGITLSREDEMKLTWGKEILALSDDGKFTRAYKGKADGSKMECIYDERGFASVGSKDARWFHPITFGAGKHLQKGAFRIVLIPTDTYTKVCPVEESKEKIVEIGLEYIVHRRGKSTGNANKEEIYMLSSETELYIPE